MCHLTMSQTSSILSYDDSAGSVPSNIFQLFILWRQQQLTKDTNSKV